MRVVKIFGIKPQTPCVRKKGTGICHGLSCQKWRKASFRASLKEKLEEGGNTEAAQEEEDKCGKNETKKGADLLVRQRPYNYMFTGFVAFALLGPLRQVKVWGRRNGLGEERTAETNHQVDLESFEHCPWMCPPNAT
jgi:hypothetical protein